MRSSTQPVVAVLYLRLRDIASRILSFTVSRVLVSVEKLISSSEYLPGIVCLHAYYILYKPSPRIAFRQRSTGP